MKTIKYSKDEITKLMNLSGPAVAAAFRNSGEQTNFPDKCDPEFLHLYINDSKQPTACYRIHQRSGETFICFVQLTSCGFEGLF